MIRRPAANGTFALITQPDHAIFAGFLAEHLGNATFAQPMPLHPVRAAVAHHDDGWHLHDDVGRATLNKDSAPLHVFEIDMPLATRIWSASAERAAPLGPYAALLVSLHQLALSAVAQKQGDPKPHERARSPQDQFLLNKFQHRQIEHQEDLRRQLNLRTDVPLKLGLAQPNMHPAEDALRFHFHLLTLCDRLSLQLCCAMPLFPEIENVEPSAQAAPLTLRTHFLNEACTELAVTPWPFDCARLSADIPVRRVPSAPFESMDTFREAYARAEVERVRMIVRTG